MTTPVASAQWQQCDKTFDGVATTVLAGQRTVTVVKGTGGSYARVSFWVRTDTPCEFVPKFLDTGGRVGSSGIVDGASRTQATNTTPAGTYTMSEAFGINASPGTALSYRQAGPSDWWVEDSESAYYNQYRNQSQGGFRWQLPQSDPNSSERLVDYPGQYAYAVVVNFNRAPDLQRAGRGAGIFLHVRGAGATAGCVAVSLAEVVTVLGLVRPGDRIVITR